MPQILAKGYAACNPHEKLAPFSFKRRDLKEDDVHVKIKYCGVCHSDIHQVRNEWGASTYPMVPGHEIAGLVTAVGHKVTRFQKGDRVGIGCMVDSCSACHSCAEKLEQYCEKGSVATYNDKEYDTGEMTFGGYATDIVVKQDFVFRLPLNLDFAASAPLLCAGITTYSPLKHWGVKSGDVVGVVGLGGLGHMAVKLANAMGAKVCVFTTSLSKKEDAKRLGADQIIILKDKEMIKTVKNSLDFIINTVAAPHDLSIYTQCLKRDGTMILVGLPDKPHPEFNTSNLIFGRKSVAGSLIGGTKETQEMLDFCGKHNIVCDIEMISIKEINNAYERALKSDVKYRFVIDMSSMN